MSKDRTATFIGHSECYGIDEGQVRREISKLIENGVTDFISGGMGNFDWMCARIVFDLKKNTHRSETILSFPTSPLT